jgi:hypothetical protein
MFGIRWMGARGSNAYPKSSASETFTVILAVGMSFLLHEHGTANEVQQSALICTETNITMVLGALGI